MRNRMYGGVRGRKTKVGRKLLRFPPTRFEGGNLSKILRATNRQPSTNTKTKLDLTKAIPGFSQIPDCDAKVRIVFQTTKFFLHFFAIKGYFSINLLHFAAKCCPKWSLRPSIRQQELHVAKRTDRDAHER